MPEESGDAERHEPLLELARVMDRLRRECPWDAEQTHRSLARYLLEETYEVLEALESDDADHLCEELGDLLMQVYFHARIAEESGAFDIGRVAQGIADKLVYRHPHVFAGLEVADAAEVERNWEALKAAEKKRSAVTEGIPAALPALAWADKVLGRLEKAGLDHPGATLTESRGTVPAPPEPVDPAVRLGEDLLALVRRARGEGIDPEQALREAVRRVVDQSASHAGPGAGSH